MYYNNKQCLSSLKRFQPYKLFFLHEMHGLCTNQRKYFNLKLGFPFVVVFTEAVICFLNNLA